MVGETVSPTPFHIAKRSYCVRVGSWGSVFLPFCHLPLGFNVVFLTLYTSRHAVFGSVVDDQAPRPWMFFHASSPLWVWPSVVRRDGEVRAVWGVLSFHGWAGYGLAITVRHCNPREGLCTVCGFVMPVTLLPGVLQVPGFEVWFTWAASIAFYHVILYHFLVTC